MVGSPHHTGELVMPSVYGMVYGREKGIQNGKVCADDM